MGKRFKILLWGAALFIFASVNGVSAEKAFIAEITADALNLRDSPSTTGRRIGSLKEGARVRAAPAIPGWAVTLIGGKREAYFSTEFIKILKYITPEEATAPDGKEKTCGAETSAWNVSVSNVSIKCNAHYTGTGYETCDFLVDVSIRSDCGGRITANVDCSVDFKYMTKNGLMPFSASETDAGGISLIDGSGSGRIKVVWRPNVIYGEVTAVKLDDCSCSIASVDDDQRAKAR